MNFVVVETSLEAPDSSVGTSTSAISKAPSTNGLPIVSKSLLAGAAALPLFFTVAVIVRSSPGSGVALENTRLVTTKSGRCVSEIVIVAVA